MIYTVTLNPALDKTVQIPSFRLGEVNRISAMRTDPGGKGINVSKVLRELGEPSVAAAILGGAAGQKIESALRALGIEGMYLFTEHEPQDRRPHAAHQPRRQRAGCPGGRSRPF